MDLKFAKARAFILRSIPILDGEIYILIDLGRRPKLDVRNNSIVLSEWHSAGLLGEEICGMRSTLLNTAFFLCPKVVGHVVDRTTVETIASIPILLAEWQASCNRNAVSFCYCD